MAKTKKVLDVRAQNGVNTQFGKSATKVTVACKVPNGILLRVFDMIPTPEPVLGGGSRMVEQARVRGEPIRLRGPSVPFGKSPRFQIAGGYALTSIPRDFWEEWVKQNKDSDLLAQKLVFAATTSDDARDMADEMEEIKSGMEALDPAHLPKTGIKGIKIESFSAE